uniref:Thymosin beta n=1 Tax=Sipha flava TaxID=143950 RepID=A0A2S2Q064_9HEMI
MMHDSRSGCCRYDGDRQRHPPSCQFSCDRPTRNTYRSSVLPPPSSCLIFLTSFVVGKLYQTDMSSPLLKDLPKVAFDLKSQLEGFNPDNMKKADTNEKIILPTAEDVAAEKTQNAITEALIEGVGGFDTGKLKHTETLEKNPLPDKTVIEAEKEQQQLIAGIENFDTKKLKPTVTEEKNPLPTEEVIAEEN